MPEDKQDKYYDILELLAKLSGYKGLSWEVNEIKDGRIHSIKNIKIDKIELRQI